MKLILLYVLFSLLVLSAHSQIVNIPDANFKNALLNHVPVINTNNDGEIQVSEAVAFTGTMNVSSKNIVNMTGVEAFTNIVTLNCQQNQVSIFPTVTSNSIQNLLLSINKLTSLNVSNLPTLKTLNCENNLLTSITVQNLPLLSELRCGKNNFTSLVISNLPSLLIFSCNANYLGSLTLNNLNSLSTLICASNPLSAISFNNVPNITRFNCDFNNFTTLNLINMPLLDSLECSYNFINSLTFANPATITYLNCSNNFLVALPVGMTALKYLNCKNNQISSIDVNNAGSLNYIDVSSNVITGNFSLVNKPFLTDIICSNNQLTTLTVSNLPFLKTLNCDYNRLGSLSITNFPALKQLDCNNNLLTSLAINNLPLLWILQCSYNKLTSLTVNNFPSLLSLSCNYNELISLTVNNLPALSYLYCSFNKLTSLPLNNLPLLREFFCSDNQLTSLSLTNFPILRFLKCHRNNITSLLLNNLPILRTVECGWNRMDTLIINSMPELNTLDCGRNNSLIHLSLWKVPVLTDVKCDSTRLPYLDLSQTAVINLVANNIPDLKYINLKNGAISAFLPMNLNALNALESICVDDNELAYIRGIVNIQLPGQNISVSSFCNFNPTGNYNTIIGIVRFDETANGCNNLDSSMNNVRINITDGTQSGSTFTNAAGKYKFYVQLSPDTVTTTISNILFTQIPLSHIVNFSGYGNTAVADFCITANGIHPDLEIMLIPVTIARPGFDAQYKLVYRNKGNQLQSGTVTLNFDAVKLNFLSAIPNVTSQTSGNLTWTYNGLTPYETRPITLVFHVNAPPVVNIGDILPFVAVINPIPGDETPADNTFNFNQVVRGAYDPNDKDVTEGPAIDISKAGDYLHYIIRFQNTGNEAAISVVIKDSLADNLDWNSFTPITASHAYRTVVSKGNKVEFIFDGINLPGKNTNEPASHGFVSFKIKPKSTIAVGETIYNKAEIYFDFNLPVVTNTVSTTFINPKQTDDTVGLSTYPNPAKDYIWFTVKPGVQIKAINLYNSVGEKLYSETVVNTVSSKKINIANLPTGILFLEVITDQGKAIQKVIRIK